MIETFVEIELKEDGDFLKVKETLTRIGVPSYTISENDEQSAKPTLWQSCHILHKRGKFYIVHFKELFALDEESRRLRGIPNTGRVTNFTTEDLARRNTIADLLESWGLVKIVNPNSDEPRCPMFNEDKILIKVISYKDKDKWNLEPKYAIGKKRNDRKSADH